MYRLQNAYHRQCSYVEPQLDEIVMGTFVVVFWFIAFYILMRK